MLAAAHATQTDHQNGIVIEYKDVVSLGKENEEMMLTLDNGDVLIGGTVMPYLLDRSVLPRGAKKSEVCWRCLLLAILPDFSLFIRSTSGCIVLRTLQSLTLEHWTDP